MADHCAGDQRFPLAEPASSARSGSPGHTKRARSGGRCRRPSSSASGRGCRTGRGRCRAPSMGAGWRPAGGSRTCGPRRRSAPRARSRARSAAPRVRPGRRCGPRRSRTASAGGAPASPRAATAPPRRPRPARAPPGRSPGRRRTRASRRRRAGREAPQAERSHLWRWVEERGLELGGRGACRLALDHREQRRVLVAVAQRIQLGNRRPAARIQVEEAEVQAAAALAAGPPRLDARCALGPARGQVGIRSRRVLASREKSELGSRTTTRSSVSSSSRSSITLRAYPCRRRSFQPCRHLIGAGRSHRGVVERLCLLEDAAAAGDDVETCAGAEAPVLRRRHHLRPLAELHPALDDLAEHRRAGSFELHVGARLDRGIDRRLEFEPAPVQRPRHGCHRGFELAPQVSVGPVHGRAA